MNPKNAACVHTVFYDDNTGVFSAYNDSNLTLPIPSTSGIFGAVSDGSMSIEDWAIQARQSPYRRSSEQQQAIDTLAVLFKGHLDPNSAATRMALLYNPLLKQGFSISPIFEL